MHIRALTPLRPDPARVRDIVSQPFDVVDTEEARLRLRENRSSFMHVVRSEIDFPEGVNPDSSQVLDRARENLERMVQDGLFVFDPEPAFYLYRLNRNGHQQTGIAMQVSVDDYLENRVRKHENVRPDRVEAKALHIDRVGANTGPIFLSFEDNLVHDLTNRVDRYADRNRPLYDVDMPNGIRHRLYRVEDSDLQSRIQNQLESLETLYIADGHHRAASAVQAAVMRRKQSPDLSPEDPVNFFLGVCFPDRQLQILPIHRVIRGAGKSASEIIDFIRSASGILQESERELVPGPGEPVLFLSQRFYKFSLPEARENPMEGDSPVDRLDVTRIHRDLISPLFGIDDPSTSDQIQFVGGLRGSRDAVEMVRSGKGDVALLLAPLEPVDVQRVADAGLVLPPKATWFDPKMRSGFLVHPLDDSYGNHR